jgi:hypothetical protein
MEMLVEVSISGTESDSALLISLDARQGVRVLSVD